MYLLVLDDNLDAKELVDAYESLIWTERYSAVGDFELLIKSDRGTRALLPVGTRLASDVSDRVMEIETVENSTDDEGVAILKIKGRSLEKWMFDRVTTQAYESGAPGITSYDFTNTPGYIARAVFDGTCRYNPVIPADNFPFLVEGSLYPPGTIAEPTETITVTVTPETVYDFIKKLCDVYNLGFRLVRDKDTSLLYFDIYTGHDRTTQQSANEVVIFSQSLENLSSPTDLTSIANQKNIAYVFSENGSMIVYADSSASSLSEGFSRRVLVVKADDISEPAGDTLNALLTQRGKEALAEHRPVLAFDGEVPQFGSYIYGQDYALGDLVEMQNSDGITTNMLVTEQIFVSDAEGDRAYPTLTMDLLITPETWLAWDTNQVWADATEEWADA